MNNRRITAMTPDRRATSDRILDAATEVFLEVGYRQATFREICRRAGANTAAINYHFRDKEGLYLEVLERVIAETQQRRGREFLAQWSRPEDKLRAFIRVLLADLLGPKGANALLTLISREMAEPTKGLDVLMEKVIRPFDLQLGLVVRELVGPTASDQQVHDCVQSVVGLCNHFRRADEVISRLGYYPKHDAQSVDHLVDHVDPLLAGRHSNLARPTGPGRCVVTAYGLGAGPNP